MNDKYLNEECLISNVGYHTVVAVDLVIHVEKRNTCGGDEGRKEDPTAHRS
jgi:hypothetical protein